MKTTVTQESPSRVRLSIEATPDEVEPALDRAFKLLAREVKVPGFRQGKVPRRILEARLDPETIREATLEQALPLLIGRAIQEENLEPIAAPSMADPPPYELGGGLSFDVTLEVRPEVTLPELSSLTVERPSAKATDEEIDQQIERMRERFATLETVERQANAGDFALIDITTTIGDETIEAGTGTDQLYEVGSGVYVPELDQELTGKRAGDILKFAATLPEGFPDHSGAQVSIQVLVKEVRQKVVPAADDEFAKTASEFETLDELREDLRTRIEQVKAQQADVEVRGRLIEQLVEGAAVEAPESLIHEELSYRAQRFAERVRGAGMTLEQYVEVSGQSTEDIERELHEQAERAVKAQLVLEEVARREEITAAREEVEEEIASSAREIGRDPEELYKQLEQAGRVGAIAGDIIRRKALEIVVERAEIRDEDS